MKHSFPVVFLCIEALFGIACDKSPKQAKTRGIDTIFLAQTHVQESSDPLAVLVGNRDALLKVHMLDPDEGLAPTIVASLSIGEDSVQLTLDGPASLPAWIDSRPGKVEHRYEDSFTAVLPAEWIRPGLTIEIEAEGETRTLQPEVGAPTSVVMTMFDVKFFGEGDGDYPEGWLSEIESKWPVSSLALIRVPNLEFPEIVVPPRAEVGAARVSSQEEYMTKTGLPFDGEQATASQWVNALSAAGGQDDLSLYYLNIYGVASGGQAGGFSGVGNGRQLGILHHELGHALSLPHWGNSDKYPYKGKMHGISAPDIFNETHAGPTWAFDLRTMTFIPPTVQDPNAEGRPPGTFKADPMQGGGKGDQEPNYLLRHFSDFSINQMREYLESKVVIYDSDLQNYVRWNAETRSYSEVRENPGTRYPIERNAEVISVMTGLSLAEPSANLVYPPIGPYQSGLVRTYDPRIESDRIAAGMHFCPNEGCDFSIQITQGGEQSILMLRAAGDSSEDPLDAKSFRTAAVNLPASAGQVTSVIVIATPDAEVNGLPANPVVLDTWNAPSP